MSFSGFSAAGLSLQTELGGRDKAFLDANRTIYQDEVASPAKAFVLAMGGE
jgi:hypothetical protein